MSHHALALVAATIELAALALTVPGWLMNLRDSDRYLYRVLAWSAETIFLVIAGPLTHGGWGRWLNYAATVVGIWIVQSNYKKLEAARAADRANPWGKS